jgi:hypothetical protein
LNCTHIATHVKIKSISIPIPKGTPPASLTRMKNKKQYEIVAINPALGFRNMPTINPVITVETIIVIGTIDPRCAVKNPIVRAVIRHSSKRRVF